MQSRDLSDPSADPPGPRAGYVLVYRPGYTNFCPGCGCSSWHVGRGSAECAHCWTALPIAAMQNRPETARPVWRPSWRALLPVG